jgi:hypothetical protein
MVYQITGKSCDGAVKASEINVPSLPYSGSDQALMLLIFTQN